MEALKKSSAEAAKSNGDAKDAKAKSKDARRAERMELKRKQRELKKMLEEKKRKSSKKAAAEEKDNKDKDKEQATSKRTRELNNERARANSGSGSELSADSDEENRRKGGVMGSPDKKRRSKTSGRSRPSKSKEEKEDTKKLENDKKEKQKEARRAEKKQKEKDRENRKKIREEKKKETDGGQESSKKTPAALFRKKAGLPFANGKSRPPGLIRSVSLKQIPGEHKRKKKTPTFIHGFDPLARMRPELDETKKAELAARKNSMNKPVESKFALAMLGERRDSTGAPKHDKIFSFLAGRPLPGEKASSIMEKRNQLRNMKKIGYSFSAVDLERVRREGVRKAKVDSLESQLQIKWDDFMDSLPKVAEHKYRQVREGYDEEGKQQLQNQGDQLIAAMKQKPPTSDTTSIAARFANPTAVVTTLQDEKIVKPSYLQNFTGEEIDDVKVAATQSNRVGKYAICPFLHANPNIAEDAQYDTIFGECASEEPGVYIWRIEYMLPIEIPEEDYPDIDSDPPVQGVLYSEDCYIILHISSYKETKKFFIFTWLGKKATQDKKCAMAIRARELNILLKNKSSIKPEMEAQESDEFLELYDYDVRYVSEGGTPSGFKQAVPPVQEPRMYRLTFAKQRVRRPRKKSDKEKEREIDEEDYVEFERDNFVMTQVRISALSLTQSDVFIVDGGTDGWIFQWNGSLAPKKLKFKGYEIRTRINRYERACRSVECEIEEGEEYKLFWKPKAKQLTTQETEKTPDTQDAWADLDDDEEDERCFWDYMKEKEYAGDDITRPPREGLIPRVDISLYKTYEVEPGKPTLLTLRTNADAFPPAKRMLDTKSVVVLDADTEIYVWIGKRSTAFERQVAKGLAQRFHEVHSPFYLLLILILFWLFTMNPFIRNKKTGQAGYQL
eukprot:TRINITY_DN2493_c1_g1_i2.p1 TRINITY_DN2493_c1_g1~~TRINITY_DN2493_c1_g1_i2.p1  ORF type:complete len:900 (+),score=228.15 TRINITY_DN2493_c1_g1_i2:271-2970(+)